MRSKAAFRTAVVLVSAVLLVAGCQQDGGTATPSESASASPSGSAAPARPTAQDLIVPRTRDAAVEITGTVPVDGVATGVAVDPIVGEVFVTTCRGCGGEAGSGAGADLVATIDTASRQVTDEIDLTGEMPGLYPQVVADPYAGVLYAARTGPRAELVSVIDATTHEKTGVLKLAGTTLWRLVVDPTTGLLYVLEEGQPDGDRARLAVLDPESGEVLVRIALDTAFPGSVAVDPVRGRAFVTDDGRGRLLVIDLAVGEVVSTVQVVPGADEPCENCLGYVGTPVVDPTTGLVYTSGSRARGPADPNESQALGSGDGAIVPLGVAPGPVTVVPAGGDTEGAVYVVDPAAGEVIDTIVVPGMVVWTRACDPSARTVYLNVIGGPATGVRALDTETHELGDPVPIEGETTLGIDLTTGTVWVAGNGGVTILE